MPDKPLIQRALELARTGQFPTVTKIKTALRSEGYFQAEAYLAGGSIRRQLRHLIAQARASDVIEQASLS